MRREVCLRSECRECQECQNDTAHRRNVSRTPECIARRAVASMERRPKTLRLLVMGLEVMPCTINATVTSNYRGKLKSLIIHWKNSFLLQALQRQLSESFICHSTPRTLYRSLELREHCPLKWKRSS